MENDEAEAIARSQRGDIEAFNGLVLRYQKAAYNLARRLCGDVATAEDATQEAFISAFQNIKGFRGGSFRAWLFRIVTNSVFTQMRRAKRRPAQSLEAAMEATGWSPASEDNPEQDVLHREEARELSQGLLSLPYDFRVAVVLRDVQGMSYEEIAETTGSSLGTVKSRIARGRALLRDYVLARR
ncbi:MAG: sigma-70 family RNA polymerase sigma factor, partial [Chloroflexi bacterium]|nr:sigma-70 family RNA polymerase sigma factor [Chloroflexota bacterium]